MSRDAFQDDIARLHGHVENMLAFARGMFEDGITAFFTLDKDAAAAVDRRKEELAEMDEEIEREALELLTLQSPFAGDLRRVAAALKLITYINRIGRYGRDIANETRRWPGGRTEHDDLMGLEKMADSARDMVRIFQEAYTAGRSPDMDTILQLENQTDRLRREVWDACLAEMRADTTDIDVCPHYMVVARYLERVGDHVCKMTEKSVYAFTGERVVVK